MQIIAARPLADSAVTLDLAAEPGEGAARRIAAAVAVISAAITRGDLPGAEEAAGAFTSVTVHYDPLLTRQTELIPRLAALLAGVEAAAAAPGRNWRLPCHYDGVDLVDLSAALGLSAQAIIDLHAGTMLRVHAIGFLPGLPFLGDLPADLACPRRSAPRAMVPAGSVAIANRMCVIYPWQSPGGWHLIGTCPVPLFDIARPTPALLQVGDAVQFYPISAPEAAALRADPHDPQAFLS